MEIDRLTVSRVIDRLYELARHKGVRLEQSRDFKKLESLLESVSEKKLTEHFRTSLNTYTPPQAFWLGGYDSAGNLIALAAARLDELGSWTLERYWRDYWSRCYPHANGMRAELADEQYRFAKSISGSVVYFGDMWVSESHPEPHVSGPFSKSLQLLALLEWRFDWCYAWGRPGFLKTGFAEKCGFTKTAPGINWLRAPSTIDHDLKVMANSREDLLDLVDFLASELLEGSSSSIST